MRLMLIGSLLFLAACRQSESPRIDVHDAWARAVTNPGGSAAAYLTITNKGAEDRLVTVESDRGTAASLHLSRMANGVMEMRPLPEGVQVPAHGEVALAPSGTHVMVERAGPLVPGDRFNLALTFDKSGTVSVPVTVVAPGTR